MAYDLIKHKFPGAPCAVGARIRHKVSGRTGHVAPQSAGDPALRVRFDGEPLPKSCSPRDVEYLDAPIVALGADK